MDGNVENQLRKRMHALSPDQQREVLQFAEKLAAPEPKGVPGKELLRFAGTLSPEEADEMRRVIEEGCEQVDLNEW